MTTDTNIILPVNARQSKQPEQHVVNGKLVRQPTTKTGKQALYGLHASKETVPQGRLLTDLAPSQLLRACHIMLAKNTLAKKLLPLRLDVEHYRSDDYVYDTSSTQRVFERMESVPFSHDGLKWIHEYHDGILNVSFYASRNVDIPYDDFVSRVDVSRVGDCFRDVLGINTEVFNRDEQGRPTLQIERIAALAQPNYSAFLGKDELDVYKLEYAEYGKDRVCNWMRTVCSPNLSTAADDSYMAFSRAQDGKATQIEFLAFQSFPLPRIMVLLGLSRIAWFRRFLTRSAYRFFWRDTFNAMVARYYGKPIGIGRPRKAAS